MRRSIPDKGTKRPHNAMRMANRTFCGVKMSFDKTSSEFNHLQFFPVIQRMYANNSVDEIKEYIGYSQLERFRKEITTLQAFGLHKQLDISLDQSQEAGSARKFSDGKVDTIVSVRSAKIDEIYRDSRNRKRYRRKVKNAFIFSHAIKSNKDLPYDENNPPHCLNCGAPLKAEAENYHCPYCQSEYRAEAYKYMLTRFYIKPVFRNFRYLWFIFIPAFVLGLLQVAGLCNEQQAESANYVFSLVMGTVLTLLLFYALAKGLRDFWRDRSVKRKIRAHDHDFSEEVFTQRLNDLLAIHPELLNAENVICRCVHDLQLRSYERQNDLEIVECHGLADSLFLKNNSKRVKLKDKQQGFTLRLARVYGALTPVHYFPDQFTCPNCGNHQLIQQADIQVCSHCKSKLSQENFDWILY